MNIKDLKYLRVTDHAFERYYHRVLQASVKKASKETATNWFKDAIGKGKKVGEDKGKKATIYMYQGHKVVYKQLENIIVTVYPYVPQYDENSKYQDVRSEIAQLVGKKLSKNIKSLRHEHRQLMIAIHKEEIKRLSVYNPNTQDIIAKKIFNLHKEVSRVEGQIQSVELVAEQYGALL